MRYKTYFVRNTNTCASTEHEFTAADYRAMGVIEQKDAGMPILEAHELVNLWNQQSGRSIYYLKGRS